MKGVPYIYMHIHTYICAGEYQLCGARGAAVRVEDEIQRFTKQGPGADQRVHSQQHFLLAL